LGASEDVLDFLGAVGGEISDHLGRVTPIIAQAMPYPGSQASLSTLLHNLEKRGLIVRDIRHRRTYAVKVTAPRPSVVAAGSGGPSENGSVAASPPSPPESPGSPGGKGPSPTDAWAAERAIYSAAIGRARQRINEFEEQLSEAMIATEEAVRRADDLQEKMAMAERTIDSMRTQLLDARKQIDLLRRKGTERRPASPKIDGNRAAAGAEWDRLMRGGPDR
jgi:hypothetical protein